MSIQNQIIEFAVKHSLKEKALNSIDTVLDASIEADKEIGIDLLQGQAKSELIYEFGRFELQIDKDENCRIATTINIYSNKLYGPNFDVPVGYYIELSDLNGAHLDEYFVFDWSPISFNIDYHLEKISQVIPHRYFKRNVPEYEFATYINHIISLVKSRDFYDAIIFVKRSLDYLEEPDKTMLNNEYLSECLDLFHGLFLFVKNNELVELEKLDKYRIGERIKKNKANMS